MRPRAIVFLFLVSATAVFLLADLLGFVLAA